MKIKLLLGIWCAVIPSVSIFSQTTLLKPAEIYIGASHGANVSTVMFKPAVKQNMLFAGYNGGISCRYITEKHLGLQMEINYSQRGWDEVKDNYTRRINYVEFPFLAHFYVGDTHRGIFNIGPKISYALNESTLKNNTLNAADEQHVKPLYHRFDYGFAAGLGYNLHTRTAGVYQLEARVYYGLGDVFANTKSDYFRTSNYLNISLNLGWYFQLTGRK